MILAPFSRNIEGDKYFMLIFNSNCDVVKLKAINLKWYNKSVIKFIK